MQINFQLKYEQCNTQLMKITILDSSRKDRLTETQTLGNLQIVVSNVRILMDLLLRKYSRKSHLPIFTKNQRLRIRLRWVGCKLTPQTESSQRKGWLWLWMEEESKRLTLNRFQSKKSKSMNFNYFSYAQKQYPQRMSRAQYVATIAVGYVE